MKAPKIPSVFKTPEIKPFSFIPRYYNDRKESHQVSRVEIKKNIKFNKNLTSKKEKGRHMKIIILIIILSLLFYNFIIN